MRILLDENFPVQLHRRLVQAGFEANHIIALGQRGMLDSDIRRRLMAEPDLVFLTQDTEFEDLPVDTLGVAIISRVPQSVSLAARVEVWFDALQSFLRDPPQGHLFELLTTGVVVGWKRREGR